MSQLSCFATTHNHIQPHACAHTHTHTLALVEEKAQDPSPLAAAPWLTAQTSPSPKPFSPLGFAAPALLCLTSVLPLWNCTLNMHLTQSDLVWWGFQGGSVVKNLLANAGDKGLIPGWGISPKRRKWQPTPVFLPRKFHAQRSLVGYSSWGCKESDMMEHTHTHDLVWYLHQFWVSVRCPQFLLTSLFLLLINNHLSAKYKHHEMASRHTYTDQEEYHIFKSQACCYAINVLHAILIWMWPIWSASQFYSSVESHFKPHYWA